MSDGEADEAKTKERNYLIDEAIKGKNSLQDRSVFMLFLLPLDYNTFGTTSYPICLTSPYTSLLFCFNSGITQVIA